MTPYLILAWTVTWSCAWTLEIQGETTANPLDCNEPLLTQCQCGESGGYQDVYVSSCQVYTAENSSICEPCPGSCTAYILCKTCSRERCLSCFPGRWGQFCENAENSEANKLNYTEETPKGDLKSYVEETVDKQMNLDRFSQRSSDKIPNENFPAEKPSKDWKYKGKITKNKNYKKLLPITVVATKVVANEQSDNNMEDMHYADVFGSNDNPEVSHRFSNNTRKFTSIQKSKEMLTVLHDSFRGKDRDELFPSAVKNVNATDIVDDKLININGSLIYTIDSVNSPKNEILNFRSGNISFSKDIDLKEDSFEETSKENTGENLNNSSTQWKYPFESSEVSENGNSEKNGDTSSKFPYGSSEVQESSNSEENVKLNSSSSQWKFPYESSEEQESTDEGKYEFKSKVMYRQPSVQKTRVETEPNFKRGFHLEDINLPSLAFSYKKGSFQASQPENESSQTSKDSKNSKTNPMGSRVSFASVERDFIKGNISKISSKRQTDSSEKISESPEMLIPLNISIFKVKIIDTEGNGSYSDPEYINASGQQINEKEKTKTSEMSDHKTSNLYQNNSKEFDIVSPLEINVLKITFLGENRDSPYNNSKSNLTEGILNENGEKATISQNKESELPKKPENKAIKHRTITPRKVSAINKAMFSLKENANPSPDGKNQNITTKSPEDNRGKNTNEKRANYKRNATKRPHDRSQYDMDILHKMIIQSSEFPLNNAKNSNGEQLYSSQSFRKTNIPDNHVLMPLYFPEMYNAEQYQSRFLDNGQLQKLCDIYPNYSPCFRVRMLSPGSPYIDRFGSRPQIHSKHDCHKSLPNGRYFRQFPSVKYYDSENKMDMRSYAKKIQNHLTDSQIFALLKQYFQSENAHQSTSSLSLQNSHPIDDIFLYKKPENLHHLIKSWNKEEKAREGFDSSILGGLVNYLLSFISPKYDGAELPAQPAVLHHNKFYRNKPAKPIAEFPLDATQPLQAGPFLNTYGRRYNIPYSIHKARESYEDNSSEESYGSPENADSMSETLPETVNSIRIKIIHPMFGQTSLENNNGKSEKKNFLESEEDTLFESCTNCVYTESVYEPVGAEKNQEKSLPTIYRALIVEEEGLLFGNQSDSKNQNASRSKRSIYSYGMHSWCPIERRMLNGDLDCTIWTYQKICNLICHPGYTCKYTKFTCSRRTNTWYPQLGPCVPIRQYNSFGYRHGNDSAKEDLSNANDNIEAMGNYDYKSVNKSSSFDKMDVNDGEASFPNYESPSQQRENDRRLPLEIKGNAKFNQIQRLSKNSTLDVRVNSKFPINGYSGVVAEDGEVNGNSKFGSIQGFPDDLTADGRGNSKFDNIHGYPGYEILDGKSNRTFDNIQGFPGDMPADGKEGYKELNGRDNSAFENGQSYFAGDEKDNYKIYNIQGVPDEVALNTKSKSKISKTQDFSDAVIMDGKDVNKKYASEDEIRNAERIFDMYEKKKPTAKNNSKKKQKTVEKKPVEANIDHNSDTIYTFFEKGNPEPVNDDSW